MSKDSNENIFDQLTASDAPAIGPEADTEAVPGDGSAPPSSPSPSSAEPSANHTPQAIKQCCQTLLKQGLLEAARAPKLYQTALTQQGVLRQFLEPFDLDLTLDDVRGLAFLTVAEPLSEDPQTDEWSHPLVRRQRLTLEQSLLVAILRKRFLIHEQEAGMGAGGAVAFVDELIPELQVYLPDLGSDLKEQERARSLLEKLKGHGIVSAVDDKDQITIRPIIAHLANPENLQALLEQYRRLSEPEAP